MSKARFIAELNAAGLEDEIAVLKNTHAHDAKEMEEKIAVLETHVKTEEEMQLEKEAVAVLASEDAAKTNAFKNAVQKCISELMGMPPTGNKEMPPYPENEDQ
ncbi:hypothetical protein Moror_2964 [Moniliophthora roreri MCA 2997]|uniref:Uncharacterized protein n=1 Tax=Moniliophthora roreri (strain MCA 2997) TaxID=1381753 RepID=V2WKL5_MONRO|nr:hypothetical protein Moror_2964 [Moniliophthora roreri MCA 2997]